MQTYDLFMMVILVAAIGFGYIKGLTWQIAFAVSLIGSYVVAVTFRSTVAQHINAEPPWNEYLAMFFLYIFASFVTWVGFAFAQKAIHSAELKDFDRQIGALIGGMNGGAVCVVITFFTLTLPLLSEEQKQAICTSKSGKIIAQAIQNTKAGLPQDVDVHLRPYLDKLDQKLKNPASETESETPDSLLNPTPGRRNLNLNSGGTAATNQVDWEKEAGRILTDAASRAIQDQLKARQ